MELLVPVKKRARIIFTAGLVVCCFLLTMGQSALASTQVPQVQFPGGALIKYVDPLPTFVGARVDGKKPLTITMKEFQQKVLSSSFSYPAAFSDGTYVWGYEISDGTTTVGPLYPTYTIEAQRGTPLTVKYVNDLQQPNGSPPFLQQYLTIDQTVHWANPLMQMDARTPYAGPAPAVVHLHGGEVPSAFDGGPDSWFTPGLEMKGAGFVSDTYTYPNAQEAATIWFHDHTLGATRINVFAGLAGFYFLRDPANEPKNLPSGNYEIEIAIQDRMFDMNGQLYFPDEGINFQHPFWIPEFFGDTIVVNGKSWPYLNVDARRYRFHFLDGSNARFYNMQLLEVDPVTKAPVISPETGKQVPGPAFWQIATDGGFLDVPVKLNDPGNNSALRLLMAPGERAEIIIDFKGYEGKAFILYNDANAPYPDGDPVGPETTGQIMLFKVETSQIADTSYDPATLAPLRSANPIVRLADPAAGTLAAGVTPAVTRRLTLNELSAEGGPLEVMVNNTSYDGVRMDGTPVPGTSPNDLKYYVTELPQVGSTEVWEIVNLTEDAHPIHLHLVQFQLINRQKFDRDKYEEAYNKAFPGGDYIGDYGPPLDYFTSGPSGVVGGNPDVTPYLLNQPRPPNPNEAGWKDTVVMYPLEVSRIVVRFAPQDIPVNGVIAGQNKFPFDPKIGPGYVWHCHIVDHEDNEMMRPYQLTGCTQDSVCDDGLYCNGVEQCVDGNCVSGQSPCAAGQECREDLKQCWDTVTIAGQSLQRIVPRPVFRASKCLWLTVNAKQQNNFSPDSSTIEVSGAADGATGVTVDTSRKPFSIGRLIFVPLCVGRGATTGEWALQIKTAIPASTLEETITASFQVR